MMQHCLVSMYIYSIALCMELTFPSKFDYLYHYYYFFLLTINAKMIFSYETSIKKCAYLSLCRTICLIVKHHQNVILQ